MLREGAGLARVDNYHVEKQVLPTRFMAISQPVLISAISERHILGSSHEKISHFRSAGRISKSGNLIQNIECYAA